MADKIVIPGQDNLDTGETTPKLVDLTPEQIAEKEASDAKLAEEKALSEKKKLEDAGNNDNDSKISIDDKEYKLNDTGDALNEDGSIFKTKSELDELSNNNDNDDNTKVEIDGVIYNIDKDGNAIDDNNAIKYTKDQLNEFADASESDIGIKVKDIIDHTKINVYDNNGNPIEFEDSPEGIEKYVESVYDKAKLEAKDEYTNNLNTTYPWLEDLLNHVNLGGDISDFNKLETYDNVKLSKDNEEQLKSIIYKARSKRGDSEDSITRYYNYLKDSDTNNDTIFDEATRELKYLTDTSKAAKLAQEEAIKSKQLEESENLSKYWGVKVDENGNLLDLGVDNSVYNIIKSKKLKLNNDTFQIPDKIKVVENGKTNLYTPDDFFTYLYEPIAVEVDGKRVITTRDNLKLTREQQGRNINNDLYDAFMRFVNYDKSQFIKEQVKMNEVKKIKKLSTKKFNNSSNSNNNRQTSTKKRVVIK